MLVEPKLDNLGRPVTMVVVMEVAGVQEVPRLQPLAAWEASQVEAEGGVAQTNPLVAVEQAEQAEMELSEFIVGR